MVRRVILLVLLNLLVHQSSAYEVVFALNCGGRAFEDSAGIEYEEDTLKEGYKSNYGARYTINRVPPDDAELYQTERYHTKSFSYYVPLQGEGKYLLVLKFSEVFFEEPHKKVFDVLLNDVPVISDLDIFNLVGHATAHDEYIPLTLSRGKLFIRDTVSESRSGRLKVTFMKGQHDNPKINAIVLVKGTDVNEFPRLPPLPLPAPSVHTTKLPISTKEPLVLDNAPDEPFQEDEREEKKSRRTSGPKQPDPYGTDSSLITVLFIVVATIIPIVILRCRL